MAIAVHMVNTPKNDAGEAYVTAWQRIDEQGLRHPKGRQSHTAWVIGDVLHVVDVWDSEDDMNDWMRTLAPILQESNMELAGQPESGHLLQIVLFVRPSAPRWPSSHPRAWACGLARRVTRRMHHHSVDCVSFPGT
jgi:heme-degrading monooxygenase HmoA